MNQLLWSLALSFLMVTNPNRAAHKYTSAQGRMKSYIAELRESKLAPDVCEERQNAILTSMLTTETRRFWDVMCSEPEFVKELLGELVIYSELVLQIIGKCKERDLFIFPSWVKGAFSFSVGNSQWDYASRYAQSHDPAPEIMLQMENEPAQFWDNVRINRQKLKPQFRSLLDKVLDTTLSVIRCPGFPLDGLAQDFVARMINHPLVEILDEDSSLRSCILRVLRSRWRNMYYDVKSKSIIEEIPDFD